MERLTIESSYSTPFANSPLLPLLLVSLATQRHTPVTKKEFKDEYDFIIVGAGSAGSVLARRLSELSCIDILLLEAGCDPPLLTEVIAISRKFIKSNIDWQFVTAPQRFTAAGHVNRQIPYAAGKTLGGSSVLNGGIGFRGNRKNYDDWAALGAQGWSYEEVLPYFLKLEDYTDWHYAKNVGGPVTIERERFSPVLPKAIEAAVVNLGFKVVDAVGPQQTGFAKLPVITRNGQRCSTAKAYLVPSEMCQNLDIVKNARVTKILIEDNQAVGVQFDYEGSMHEIKVRKEVILSAGALNSAQLLMLSGIGPLSELNRLQIPIVADLPVGLNLQDHIGTILPYDASGGFNSLKAQLKAKENIQTYIFNRTGPLTYPEGCFSVSFLNKYIRNSDFPDFGIYTAFFNLKDSVKEFGWSEELVEQLNGPYACKATIVCVTEVINPKSRGFVLLKSSDPYDAPIFDPNYLENFQDVENLVQGMKTCRRIFSSTEVEGLGITPFETSYKGCEDLIEDEDLYFRCIARTALFPFNHPVGTAKMGNSSDPTTVVDPQLRVKNVKGLRVVDASVMPTIPWSNTVISVIMIAEKASDMIKATISC